MMPDLHGPHEAASLAPTQLRHQHSSTKLQALQQHSWHAKLKPTPLTGITAYTQKAAQSRLTQGPPPFPCMLRTACKATHSSAGRCTHALLQTVALNILQLRSRKRVWRNPPTQYRMALNCIEEAEHPVGCALANSSATPSSAPHCLLKTRRYGSETARQKSNPWLRLPRKPLPAQVRPSQRQMFQELSTTPLRIFREGCKMPVARAQRRRLSCP